MKLEGNTGVILKTVLPLIVIIVLFFVVGKFGFGKITDIRNQVADADSTQKILTQKSSILSNLSVNGLQMSNQAVSAFPNSNPALSVMTQLKSSASSSGLSLTDMKTGNATAVTGYNSISVTFNLSGSISQIESFLNGLSDIAPITIVDRVKLTGSSQDSSLASVTVKSFFAPFPAKIPAADEAIKDLTPDETNIMKNISSLTQPLFSQIPASPGGKADPFAQ